eukprot:1160181-Pelagomonas_calceolata.AAC.3
MYVSQEQSSGLAVVFKGGWAFGQWMAGSESEANGFRAMGRLAVVLEGGWVGTGRLQGGTLAGLDSGMTIVQGWTAGKTIAGADIGMTVVQGGRRFQGWRVGRTMAELVDCRLDRVMGRTGSNDEGLMERQDCGGGAIVLYENSIKVTGSGLYLLCTWISAFELMHPLYTGLLRNAYWGLQFASVGAMQPP